MLRHIERAMSESMKSVLLGRKVGCVIEYPSGAVICGHNHVPSDLSGLDIAGYKVTICAELSALELCNETKCSLYTWPVPPCVQCTIAIITSGKITRVVVPKPDAAHPVLGGRWKKRWEWSKAKFVERGIEVIEDNDRALVGS